jgi:hypothetical protein
MLYEKISGGRSSRPAAARHNAPLRRVMLVLPSYPQTVTPARCGSEGCLWERIGGLLCSLLDTCSELCLVVEACMSSDSKLSEWNLLLDQFQALVREGSDSIEDIFDVKLIDQAVEADWRQWDNRGQ